MFKNYTWPDSPKEKFDGVELKNLYNGLWQVTRRFAYKGLTIPVGFESDLFSIPRLARWAYPKSMERGNVAAIVHDYMLKHMYATHSRDFADKIFLDAMRDAGVSKPRMMVIHTGVSGYTQWLKAKSKIKKAIFG